MNNEPVAWRTHYPSGWEYKDGNPPFELTGNSQLLYTHPAKEVPKEVILKLAEESGFMLVSSHPNDMAFPIYEASQDTIETFARAILRKVQEKC